MKPNADQFQESGAPEISPRRILLLSTADWDSPLWTNKQNLAARLSSSIPVVYVNSLGLRKPRFTIGDLKRVRSALQSRRPQGSRTALPPNLTIIRPRVIPFHSSQVIRKINAWSLNRQIDSSFAPKPEDVLWSFSPLTFQLERKFQYSVYHSVDLLHEVTGISRDMVLAAEKQFVHNADLVVGSSIEVCRHLTDIGADPVLWENVADVVKFSSIERQRTPAAIFAGNISGDKLDFKILNAIADQGITLKIAGPVSIDGTSENSALLRLLRLPNVQYLGLLSPDLLAAELNQCTVGLLPYLLNGYTRGVFPLKLYEYLASGLAVVSTPLPSLATLSPEIETHVSVVESALFATAVTDSIEIPTAAAVASRRGGAEGHSWESRTRQALSLLDTLRPVQA